LKVQYRLRTIKEVFARDRVGGAEPVTGREGCGLVDIEHFALNVPDPVAAAAWYVRHLGMRVVRSQGAAPFTHFLADGSHRVIVEMYGHTKAPVTDYGAMDTLV
jgi:hypothetical protein